MRILREYALIRTRGTAVPRTLLGNIHPIISEETTMSAHVRPLPWPDHQADASLIWQIRR